MDYIPDFLAALFASTECSRSAFWGAARAADTALSTDEVALLFSYINQYVNVGVTAAATEFAHAVPMARVDPVKIALLPQVLAGFDRSPNQWRTIVALLYERRPNRAVTGALRQTS